MMDIMDVSHDPTDKINVRNLKFETSAIGRGSPAGKLHKRRSCSVCGYHGGKHNGFILARP